MRDRSVTSVPTAAPWPRPVFVLAIVLCGITLAWDCATAQVTWSQRSFTVRPSPNYDADLVWDAGRRRLVFLGGTGPTETWEYDGAGWTRRATTLQPPGPGRLAYDSTRRRTVYFQLSGNETWEWDGNAWSKMTPKVLPPPRWGAGLAYDPVRRRTLMFGGTGGTTLYNDTWEWDGQQWTRRNTTHRPVAGDFAQCMVTDPTRGRIVLLQSIGALWAWNGNDWSQLTLPKGPANRAWAGMAFDAARDRLVLFGGETIQWPHQRIPTLMADTWEWDGRSWRRIAGTVAPSPRSKVAMAYDSRRGCLVLFGGLFWGPFTPWTALGDTWELAPHDLRTSVPDVSVAGGGTVPFTLDAGVSMAGRSYHMLGCLDAGARPGIPLGGGVTLMLLPDTYFQLTATQPAALFTNGVGVLDGLGRATASIRVPAGIPPAWIGTRFLHAYVVYGNKIDFASTPVPLTLVQ